jgi:hypothetical protein
MSVSKFSSQQKWVPPNLSLSAIEVKFFGDKIDCGQLAFESKEKLKQFRKEHESTHIIHRSGDSVIAIPLTSGAQIIGETRHLSVKNDKLQKALIRDVLVRHFSNQGFKLKRNEPTEIVDTSRNLVFIPV